MSDEQRMKERLKALGIDEQAWAGMGGHGPQTPRFALKMAGDLQKMKGLLEAAVGEKQAEVGLLEEKLLRLKYGGGS